MSAHIPAALACRVCHQRAHYASIAGFHNPLRKPRSTWNHVEPRRVAGLTVEGNLALACVTCSLKKAARTEACDPLTKKLVPLFHPRRDHWPNHFRQSPTGRLIGCAATGRATIVALGMNRPAIVAIRQALAALEKIRKER